MNMNEPLSGPSEYHAWLADVRALVQKHVGAGLAYYELHTRKPWLLFRVCGSLLIVLSISLPVLSTLKVEMLPQKELVVSLVALSVAVLSAFSTFFHWHDTWRENTRAKLELRELLALWELKLLAASQESNSTIRIQAVVTATEALLSEARKVGTSNTEGYFKNVSLPDIKN
jgi:hypothetical protein